MRKFLDAEIYKDLKADLNTKGLDEWTALFYAAADGHIEVVEELLKE